MEDRKCETVKLNIKMIIGNRFFVLCIRLGERKCLAKRLNLANVPDSRGSVHKILITTYLHIVYSIYILQSCTNAPSNLYISSS